MWLINFQVFFFFGYKKLSSFGIAEDKADTLLKEKKNSGGWSGSPGVPINVYILHMMIHFLDSESGAGLGDVTLCLLTSNWLLVMLQG